MLVLPAAVTLKSGGVSIGVPPRLDWTVVANTLDAVRAEGFSVVGLKALCLNLPCAQEAVKLCRLASSQAQALLAAASTAAAGPHMLALALARDNAVLHLQIKVQEAALASSTLEGASAGKPGEGPAMMSLGRRGPSLAPVFRHVAAAGSSSMAEQQLLFFFDQLPGSSAAAGHPSISLSASTCIDGSVSNATGKITGKIVL